MSQDIIIRPFVEGDIEDLIKLVDENQPKATAEDKKAFRQYILGYVQNPDSTTYLLAELNGKLIGYVEGIPFKDLSEGDPLLDQVNNVDEMYYGEEIFVTASQRLKGVSKKLYQSMVNYALSEGYKGIVSLVSVNNEPSLRLCRSFGMQEKSLRDSVIFTKRLDK